MRDAIEAARAAWDKQFGGGMIPFDDAYHAALREGSTIAEAQRAGVAAVLDAFATALEVERG